MTILLTAPGPALGNWGMEVGRANEADNARLIQDWNSLKVAENRLKNSIALPLAKERQRHLLGLPAEQNVNLADLLNQAYKWWMEKVLTPAQEITKNPAASCQEAMHATEMVLGMMRQRALLGLGGDENDVEQVRLDEELMQALQTIGGLVLIRCREEALDECTATGRIAQIFQLVFIENRQAALMPGLLEGQETVETWAVDALKQCAIYELKFNSTTKLGPIPFAEIVRDRSIPIKFDGLNEEDLVEIATSPEGLGKFLKGQTEGTSDLIFTSIKCGVPVPPPASVTCQPEMKSDPIKARITKLDLSHREYAMKNGVSMVIPEVGKDEFSFEFSGGHVALRAVMKAPGGFETAIPTELFSYAFYIAHQKDQIGKAKGQETLKIQRNKRGVYPVMFQFTYADQTTLGAATSSDSTEFRLIHKPEPKPFTPRGPERIRKPLKPRPGGH
jgi:hypothetical protein